MDSNEMYYNKVDRIAKASNKLKRLMEITASYRGGDGLLLTSTDKMVRSLRIGKDQEDSGGLVSEFLSELRRYYEDVIGKGVEEDPDDLDNVLGFGEGD